MIWFLLLPAVLIAEAALRGLRAAWYRGESTDWQLPNDDGHGRAPRDARVKGTRQHPTGWSATDTCSVEA